MIVGLMTQLQMLARGILSQVATEERAQDTFEYLLIIGGVVVAVIIAVATPVGQSMISAVVAAVCAAINTIPSLTVSC